MKRITSLVILVLFTVFNTQFALAADTAAPAQGGGFGSIIFLVLIVAFMYFMIWRPQQKKAKAQRELVSSVAGGDEIMISGGIVGTVKQVMDNYLVLSVNETNDITVQRNAVSTVLPKGTLAAIK